MNALNRALCAESIKIRRTLALWLALLTPGALVFLEVAAATQRQGNVIQAGANEWQVIFEHVFSVWVILILPLYITLETALLGQLEHSNNTWKVMHTQPIPRWATVAAKQIWSLGLVALGKLALIVLTLAGGAVLDAVMPELFIEAPIPWEEMFRQVGIGLLAAGTILAIHTWVALRSRSFVVASGIGIGMTIAGLILSGLDCITFFPWSMPAVTLQHYYEGVAIATYLVVGVIGWLGLSLVGNWNVRRLEQ